MKQYTSLSTHQFNTSHTAKLQSSCTNANALTWLPWLTRQEVSIFMWEKNMKW